MFYWKAPNGRFYRQVRDLAGKCQQANPAFGAESPTARATPALVRCKRCWVAFVNATKPDKTHETEFIDKIVAQNLAFGNKPVKVTCQVIDFA